MLTKNLSQMLRTKKERLPTNKERFQHVGLFLALFSSMARILENMSWHWRRRSMHRPGQCPGRQCEGRNGTGRANGCVAQGAHFRKALYRKTPKSVQGSPRVFGLD